MSSQHIRNAIVLLLVLTLTNICASFATLYSARELRDFERAAVIAQKAT